MRLPIFCLALAVLLNACDDTPKNDRVFEVEISNITAGQVLTPPAIFLHHDHLGAWDLGKPASAGLEVLAEGGNPDDLIAENRDMSEQAVAGDGIIMAGNSFRVMLTSDHDEVSLSMASMLALSNDAFTAVTDMPLDSLSVGASVTVLAPVYDAGTEANTETAASVPGLNGEGFHTDREARNTVVIHPGIVSQDDGLGGSGLSEVHRFLNYAARVKVTRIE